MDWVSRSVRSTGRSRPGPRISRDAVCSSPAPCPPTPAKGDGLFGGGQVFFRPAALSEQVEIDAIRANRLPKLALKKFVEVVIDRAIKVFAADPVAPRCHGQAERFLTVFASQQSQIKRSSPEVVDQDVTADLDARPA